jgi:hypothetical protein
MNCSTDQLRPHVATIININIIEDAYEQMDGERPILFAISAREIGTTTLAYRVDCDLGRYEWLDFVFGVCACWSRSDVDVDLHTIWYSGVPICNVSVLFDISDVLSAYKLYGIDMKISECEYTSSCTGAWRPIVSH